MKPTSPKIAAAAALVGLLAAGGATLAYAADSPSTTTAPTAQTAPPAGDAHTANGDDPNCPNMGGSSAGPGASYGMPQGAPNSGTSPTPTPSQGNTSL